jgi:hypothetical protein
MKKILLSLFVVVMGFATKVQAQCNFISPTVELNFITTPVPGFCEINFNLSFEIAINSGNKYTFVHMWRTSNYDAWVNNANYDAYSTNQNTQPEFNNPGGETLNILQDAVATIILNNDNIPVTFETSYGPDPDAPVKHPGNTAGLSVVRVTSGANYRYTISNLSVSVPTPPGPNGCNSVLSFTGDAWSSQANNGNPPIHCAMLGWTYTINDVTITGFKNCVNPLRYSMAISTTQVTAFDVYYDVYVDDGDLVYEPLSDFLVVNDKGPISISNVAPYSGNLLQYDDPNSPYALPAYKDRSLWYVVTSPTVFSNVALYEANNACATLPVNIKSFTALRNKADVNLKWETIWEQNNTGFAVERNMAGNWEQIGFVASQAPGGNSADLLNYVFTDINNNKGITQYRIRQIDFDNKSKYSEIRTIRGEAQIGKIIVYPNPTFDGKVKVSFEDASVLRDVSLIDMNGRVLKQWKAITDNNITIENLTMGMYTLRVVVPATGEQTVEKIVVSKK